MAHRRDTESMGRPHSRATDLFAVRWPQAFQRDRLLVVVSNRTSPDYFPTEHLAHGGRNRKRRVCKSPGGSDDKACTFLGESPPANILSHCGLQLEFHPASFRPNVLHWVWSLAHQLESRKQTEQTQVHSQILPWTLEYGLYIVRVVILSELAQSTAEVHRLT